MKTPEKNREIAKRHYYQNREDKLAYQKQYSKDNAESVALAKQKWAKENIEKCRESKRKWREKNKDRIHQKRQEKRKNDPQFRLHDSLSTRVRLALRAQGTAESDSITKLIGCTPLELKKHLESKFWEGMGWDNYGYWHIDHIKPLVLFDLTDRSQQLIAFNWTNMQPLWAPDNLSKSDKYEE